MDIFIFQYIGKEHILILGRMCIVYYIISDEKGKINEKSSDIFPTRIESSAQKKAPSEHVAPLPLPPHTHVAVPSKCPSGSAEPHLGTAVCCV